MTVSKLVVTVVALAVLVFGSQRLWRGAAEPPPPVPADTPCVAAGTPVDVRIWFGREQFMPDDRFRSFHAAPDLFDVMTDTAWDMASFEGTRHGLALHHGVFWNVYRQDAFDELGLALPKTWDEVLDAAVAISEARRASGMYGYTLNASNAQPPVFDRSRFAQMSGQWVDGVMQIDSPAGHYWLHWMQRAVRRGAVSPNTIAFDWQDVITNFRNGLAGMATISRNLHPIDIAPSSNTAPSGGSARNRTACRATRRPHAMSPTAGLTSSARRRGVPARSVSS